MTCSGSAGPYPGHVDYAGAEFWDQFFQQRRENGDDLDWAGVWTRPFLVPLREAGVHTVLELGLHARAQHVTLITTGRLDAVLHEPPPERTRHTIGRPRVVGARKPSREQV